jgi:Permuted papain-like amidase enzyme, YaeF/YiiX, C92 family
MQFFFQLLLLIIIMSVPVISNATAPPPDPAFQKHIAADSRSVIILRTNLRKAADFARSRSELFSPAREYNNSLLSREDKMAIWGTWSSVLDSLAGLDVIRREHKKFDLFQDSERKNASFTIANASFLAGYRHALDFIALADKNPALDTILNEDVPELGIPAGTFNRFKFRFLNVAIAGEFAALQVIGKSCANGSAELRSAIEEDGRAIWEMGKGKGHQLTLKNALAVVQKSGFAAWFPLQKGISGWMGDTKVLRKGNHLVSARQIEEMGKRLQPGDIIFERHEWYLSNMGLPGFWTHVALYIGTPEERRTYFKDLEVSEWVKGLGNREGDYEALLRQRYPTAYGRSLIQKEDRRPVRILEAISEGVSFTSLEYTAASDSIAVIRPKLSKKDKAQAIMRAFHYSGRPYDFNFDFQTDSALVCSELIFKAYEPGSGMRGISFPVSEVMGRKVSTPNGMVRQFDEQTGRSIAQAEFVLFLDGYEKGRKAVESSADKFRKSWQRPNWHILIQDAPEEAKRL